MSSRRTSSAQTLYAHSVPGRPVAEWERLGDHLHAVGGTSGKFGSAFGCGEIARAAGLLHDIGKASAAFQRYIGTDGGERASGPDHSSAGALEAAAVVGPAMGRLLAFTIAGHHAGLADGVDLDARLTKVLEPYDGWRPHAEPLPDRTDLASTSRPRPGPEPGFTPAFLIRMLFSCLVDADRLETAAFYAAADGRGEPAAEPTSLAVLRDRLSAHMDRTGRDARESARTDDARRLNQLRADILAHVLGKADLAPGLFTLTVPTGGGKTLASLSFALEHGARHGLRRVVYVAPFTSIIEQTAAVFRRALAPPGRDGNDTDILEHHATFDWDAALRGASGEEGRGTNPAERLLRAAENWDAPVVVTTAVQFFESLFANKPSRCRKLHNLARSVIVLDEAQTLPLRILRPCLAALDELARNYGTSIMICTATQPAWRRIDGTLVERHGGGRPGRNFGLDIPTERELAPEPPRLFAALKRVTVEQHPEPIGDDVVTARFAEQAQMLCIVNSRRHARRLFDAVAHLPGAVHLSTWMCPRHRRLVLERARRSLSAGEPVRVVSTSLIEAGVDIDFPEVWRAATGLDSILQAAGRCNREFKRPSGRLVIFSPDDDKAPHDLQQAWTAGRTVLRHGTDPQTLEAVTAYFGELYGNAGSDALDASTLPAGPGGTREPYPILASIGERARDLTFPFATIAKAFRVIEDTAEPVIVPWSVGPEDDEAAVLLSRIAAADAPSRADLRRLQQYTVSIPRWQRDRWLAQGVLRPVHRALGDTMLRFDDLALYDARSGLRVDEPEQRDPLSNVM